MIRDESLWVTQKSIASLFGVSVSTISRHLKNIYETGELSESATFAKIATVQSEGSRTVERETSFYNLDAIISVGYRVNSLQATRFRQWATKTLKAYMIKGFVLDDERLKQGSTLLGKDYFEELLERVRSIRASERRIWQKITDIFAEISSDYDKNSPVTQQFYATVQNKFHDAIAKQTADEIIYNQADSTKPHMGLTSWKNAPDGSVLKSDTGIAKNYLSKHQIAALERNVSSYFDYIEDLITRRNTFTMREFAESIDCFLSFREYDILPDRGSISMAEAKKKAGLEYDIFNKTQTFHSDFDGEVENLIEHSDWQ